MLADLIVKGIVENGFRSRDVYRRGRTALQDREDARVATDTLVALGWLAETVEVTGGRPTSRFWIHPQILERARNRAARTDERPVSSVLSVPATAQFDSAQASARGEAAAKTDESPSSEDSTPTDLERPAIDEPEDLAADEDDL